MWSLSRRNALEVMTAHVARISWNSPHGKPEGCTIVSVSVTKWVPSDAEIGSPVLHDYGDPAMADKVVHFVGRQRGASLLPPHVFGLSTEQRLASILTSGLLFGFQVYRSQLVPVVSLSDLSAAELETAFARGINTRGPVEPWAVVLYRVPTWEVGFRPVIYADAAHFDEHRAALTQIHGPGWEALAVQTEMRREMTRADWTAEREWRFCFAPDTQPVIDIRAGIAAVVVGRSGWVPSEVAHTPASLSPERWLWDSSRRRLVHDGRIPLP